MISLKEILLLGGGSHCNSVIDTIREQKKYSPVGILDFPDKVGTNILKVPIIGTDEQMKEYFDSGIKYAFISVGSIVDTAIREKLYQDAIEIGFEFPKIVDPTAIISDSAIIGQGTFVGKGSIINSNVHIGSQSIINSGTIIEHDNTIGDFVHIAPGSTLSGNVTIGNRTHIGTNSTIIQEVIIGENTLIGAGSVVLNDIGNNKKAYGNPSKVVEND